jgi:hypothetical protein
MYYTHLQLRHRQLSFRKCLRELQGLLLLSVEESNEDASHLVPRGIANELLYVTPPRPYQRRIEPLDVVRGHEQHPALLGGCSVDRVEKAGEGDAWSCARAALLQLATDEHLKERTQRRTVNRERRL